MTAETFADTAVVEGPALTAAELDRARRYLRQTQDGVTGAIKGLTDAQWTFSPDPARWSIAQNVEHMIVVLELVLGPIHAQLEAAPPVPAGYDVQQVDDIVVYRFPNRLVGFNAPPIALPVGNLRQSEALARLMDSYVRLAQRLESTPGLRHHAIEAMPLKGVSNGAFDLMDGYQWILAAAAHTERHTKQVLEVRADVGFPQA